MQGPKGEQGIQGIPGEPGKPFPRVYGLFFGNNAGPYTGGSIFEGTIIPVTGGSPINTPDAFTINDSGSVTVNVSGVYLVIGRLQLDAGSKGNFVVQVNERGVRITGVANSGTVVAGTAIVTTILPLNEGDRVSNGYIGTDPVSMVPFIQQVRSNSSILTLIKIDDLTDGLEALIDPEAIDPSIVIE